MKRILKSLVLMLGMLMVPAAAVAQNMYADVNGDLEVNIADINAVIGVILSDVSNPSADVNGDGEVNIADINVIISVILNGTTDPFLEVCKKVVEADQVIANYCEQCETLEELKEHVADIEALDNVDYVFSNNTTLFVVIKDYGTISYSFYPSNEETVNANSLRHNLGRFNANNNQSHGHEVEAGDARAGIVFQMSNDEKWNVSSEFCDHLAEYFNDAGIVSKVEKTIDIEFFRNGIFNYDYLFLLTHGEYECDPIQYNINQNYRPLHWLYTTEKLPSNVIEKANFLYLLRKQYDEKDVSHGSLKELHNGKEVFVPYLKVSDRFIASSARSFHHPEKAVVVNAACQSLKGPGLYVNDTIDYEFATVFEQKGAGAYFGYDETNSRGDEAGIQFYFNLLSGMSIKAAYDNLQFDILHDKEYNDAGTKTWWADLVPSIQSQEINNSCIIRPLLDFKDNSNDNELSILLNANITCGSMDYTYIVKQDDNGNLIFDMDFDFNNLSDVLKFGFELSKTAQFTNAERLNEMRIGDDCCVWGGDSGDELVVNFSQSLTYSAGQTDAKIKPNTTYWARAYVYDGQGYNYSEPITFTTGSIAGENPQTETFTVNGVSFTMVTVDGGTFLMGDSEGIGSSKERPAHQVTLSTFSIGQTEVTQALWNAVMGINPSYFNSNFSNPVEQITWGDCQLFISELNKLTGRGFRLPTNAEWEFAARGGNHSLGFKYSGSNIADDVAWHEGNANNTTHVVANKAPNELGLYDMSGNVWEWCQDWFEDYSSNAQTNPTGPASGSYRVMRSGSYDFEDFYCRVAHRNRDTPERTSPHLGMRLALDDVFHLSDSIVKMHVDDEKIVYIFNGSGQYSVNGDSGIIDTFIQGNQLILKGKSKGIATLTISDDIKKVTKYLKVYVDTYEWVDLGLPSGTLWAMYNVGANSPEEYGDYFAWGETTPKEVYSWRTYKWSNGDFDELTKYCNDSYYGYNGFTDGKMKLDLEDDAAYVNWGPEWRIPTLVQMYELCTKCSWRSSSLHGVYGVIVTGPNGNSLFLPAAGYRYYGSLEDVDEEGYYWSNQIVTNHPCDAAFFGNYYYDDFYDAEDRSIGFPVRAVHVP